MKLYRYDDRIYACIVDAERELWGTTTPKLVLSEFEVLKRTRCGAWIVDAIGHRRFVNLEASKRYACPSAESAMESFVMRKRRQIRILRAKLVRAEQVMALTQNIHKVLIA